MYQPPGKATAQHYQQHSHSIRLSTRGICNWPIWCKHLGCDWMPSKKMSHVPNNKWFKTQARYHPPSTARIQHFQQHSHSTMLSTREMCNWPIWCKILPCDSTPSKNTSDVPNNKWFKTQVWFKDQTHCCKILLCQWWEKRKCIYGPKCKIKQKQKH